MRFAIRGEKNMFTAALVEDEYWAMTAIANTFPWKKYGFEPF